jgi:hypothetical protein
LYQASVQGDAESDDLYVLASSSLNRHELSTLRQWFPSDGVRYGCGIHWLPVLEEPAQAVLDGLMRTRAIGCRPVDAEFAILQDDAQREY